MNWLNKLERKWGKYAITNLSIWVIGAYVIGYLISSIAPALASYLTLEPYAILHGQIWRLITWVLIPPSKLGLLTFIMLFFYYSLGTTLERTWGTFRYNVYIFSGLLFTIIGAFVLYFVNILSGHSGISSLGMGDMFSTYYINLSIFLAFAACYPEMKVMLYFIIPIKIKWMAYLDVAYLLYVCIVSGWADRVAIIASLFNFVVFFFSTRNYQRVSPGQIRRRHNFQKQMATPNGITKHKCAICGRTEKDGDNLEFRFCSKCQGNYEYCQEHLFTHEHRKR